MDFIYFLGRFHVLALHLPIGIMTLAIVFEVLVRWRPFRFLTPAIAWTWFAGGVTGVGTVALGFMHAMESGFQDSSAVEAHRLAGITLTALGFLIWILRLRLEPTTSTVWPKWAKDLKADDLYAKVQPIWAPGGKLDQIYNKSGWIVASVLAFVMMSVTGHLGGNLTHGETYLVQYAPKPIRRLAGLSAETDPRPAPKDLASADIYLDIVGPALHARCDGCHNDGKASGGLSIADHAKLLKGGKGGPVITPPDAAKSDLFRRINLPSSSADFMPKDGKTPLTPEQTAAVGVWIKAGAPKSAAVGSLKLSDADKAILAKALGLGGGDDAAAGSTASAAGGKSAHENDNLPKVQPGDAAAIKALESVGFIVRPVAADSNLLDVDYTITRALTDADFANLKKIAPQILRLNLRRSGIGDDRLKEIATYTNLRRLRLENTDVTDAGLPALAPLKALFSLNLASTKVTDGGMAALAGLPNLHRVYLWNTTVSPGGVTQLKTAKPEAIVYAGLTRADVAPPGPLMQPVN
jgi:hypothetical protein